MIRGFTIVELLVSVAIFIIMTSLVVSKYGNFNQSTLLTDTAYDIALTMRAAQTYGLSVRSNNAAFIAPYGIDFNVTASPGGNTCSGGESHSKGIVLFADTYPVATSPGDGVYDASPNCDTPITLYAITRGAYISGLCAGTGLSCTNSLTQLDVSFRRPNPDAVIYGDAVAYKYAEITLRATDGSTRIISVRQNGQISVQQ